jgi:hypothetical protein
MALTSKISDEFELPDGTARITIRKLSHHQLMMAVDESFKDTAAKMKSLEGITLPASSDEERARQRAEAQQPRNKYNRAKILEYGITAWTYDVALTEDFRADLDEDSALYIFDRVIDLSIRTPDEKKESASISPPISDQEKDNGPSN